uniref:Complex 1 LYR protein domain-containing protein n=1 Tax=Globisporangium ultimum (strain ATCC 200006 / CBS 805.95 / DAOM BR144) TaxID=431595 RepID=K3WLY3_GLOUD
MTEAKEVVRIYRRILKLAAQYPSIKRNAIIRDIKLEFRENKHLTDASAIHAKVQSARQGIVELSQYTNLNPSSMTWKVDVGREVGQGPPAGGPVVNAKVVGEK